MEAQIAETLERFDKKVEAVGKEEGKSIDEHISELGELLDQDESTIPEIRYLYVERALMHEWMKVQSQLQAVENCRSWLGGVFASDDEHPLPIDYIVESADPKEFLAYVHDFVMPHIDSCLKEHMSEEKIGNSMLFMSVFAPVDEGFRSDKSHLLDYGVRNNAMRIQMALPDTDNDIIPATFDLNAIMEVVDVQDEETVKSLVKVMENAGILMHASIEESNTGCIRYGIRRKHVRLLEKILQNIEGQE